jgi:hypothetical protein
MNEQKEANAGVDATWTTIPVVSADAGVRRNHPGEIPLGGWKDVLWRAWRELSEQNLFVIAGGVTSGVPGGLRRNLSVRRAVPCGVGGCRRAVDSIALRPAHLSAGTASGTFVIVALEGFLVEFQCGGTDIVEAIIFYQPNGTLRAQRIANG